MKLMTQQLQLKSLIEDGRYQPQPELVAEAMLRRRGVRALLTGGGDQPSWSNPVASSSSPPGSLISTPSPATTVPIRVSPPWLLDRRHRGGEPLLGQRREQLVVFAAGRRQLERVAPGAGRDLGEAGGERQRRRRRSAGRPRSPRRCARRRRRARR